MWSEEAISSEEAVGSVPFMHEMKLLYVRYDALMNATDVWEDMNMICRYIDEVHTYTIGCGLHNMSIYIRRYSFEAPTQ